MDKDDAFFRLTVRGKTLRDVLLQAKSLEDRLRLLPRFFDLCESVAKAHDLGIAVRNVHPGNVLLTEAGDTLLMDWSLCRTRGKSDPAEEQIRSVLRAYQNNESPGTDLPKLEPACLAPEIVLEHAEDIDVRADVYSLGTILYEILTGRPAFTGTDSEVIQNGMRNAPESVTSLEPHAPQHLAGVCRRALHREPSARYTSARLLLEDAKRLQSTSASPGHSSPGETLALYGKALGVAAVVLVVLACAALLGWAKASRMSGELESVRADLGRKVADAQDAAGRLDAELKATQQARATAEAERDLDHEKLVGAQATISAMKLDLDKTEELRKAAEQKLAQQASGAAPGGTPPSALAVMPQPPAASPDAEPPAAALPAPRPPTPSKSTVLTKAELQNAVGALAECLKEEKAGDGSPAIVVRLTDGVTPSSVSDLGFKDGDVITQVDRAQVASVDEARKLLARSAREAGFSVRITREGQSSWMRIATAEPRPSPPPAPPARKATPPVQRKPAEEASEQPQTDVPAEPVQEEPAPTEPAPEGQGDVTEQAPEEQPDSAPAAPADDAPESADVAPES